MDVIREQEKLQSERLNFNIIDILCSTVNAVEMFEQL